MTRRPPPPPGPLTLAIEVSNPSAGVSPGGKVPLGGMAPALRSYADPNSAHHPLSPVRSDILGPSVALARGMLVLDQEPLITADRHDDDLMPAIDRLVRRAGFTPRDLERIAVSIGPGGFTGLRVAIATAKALGEAIIARGGNPACCVPVLTASIAKHNFFISCEPRYLDRPLAVALASKRDSVWLMIVNQDDDLVDLHRTQQPDQRAEQSRPLVQPPDHQAHVRDLALAGAVVAPDQFEQLHRTHAFFTLLADQFLPDSFRDRARNLGIEVIPPALSAAACAQIAAHSLSINPAALLPLYPREPEAVTKWRTLHPKPGPKR